MKTRGGLSQVGRVVALASVLLASSMHSIVADARTPRDNTDVGIALTLPSRLTQPAEIGDPRSGMLVRFSVPGASDVEASTQGNVQRFERAFGSDRFERHADPDGVEDLIRLRPGSTLSELRYAVTLHGVAGLRLVGRSLEFLDDTGTPRLRIAPPYIIPRGQRAEAADLRLEGCNADYRPTPPWGKAPIPPGSESCQVVVSWSPSLAKHGAVLDPYWTTTQDMAVSRTDHGAVLMDDGRVLVAGEASTTVLGTTAEIFDPSSGTWAMTGSSAGVLDHARAVRLGSNRFVFVAATHVEVYDPTTGTFTAAPDLSPTRNESAVARLPDGSVLVTGGRSPSSDYFNTALKLDATTLQWTPAGTMKEYRSRHTATALADGRVLVVGGVVFGTISNTAEIYDPKTGAWTLTPGGPSVQHNWHTATLLSGGRVLVVGNTKANGEYADVFDPTSGQWSQGAKATYSRYAHAAVALSDGSALLIGGYGHDSSTSVGSNLKATESWYSTSGQFVVATPTNFVRYQSTATVLSDDGITATILVTGGSQAEKKAEILQAKLQSQACVLDRDCLGGACVDGRCCDARCDGACSACAAALKGSGKDGECEFVNEGTDPDEDCATEDVSTCGQTGVCDASGACALYPAGTECKEGVCWTDRATFVDGKTYACDGSGSCKEASEDCCYYQGQKLDYCSCLYGVCDFSSAGASSTGGTGAFGGGGFSGYGNGGSGGTTSAPTSGSSSGCGCRTLPSQNPLRSNGPLLLALASALALARRRHWR
ncbi:MAG: kelch repeat-containing protein [Polyangiaceae bacterium]